jgi:hypothetical protein
VDFVQFKEWVFLGVLSGGVLILWQMKEKIKQINYKLEVLLVVNTNTRESVKDHEIRLRKIETE